MISKYGVKLSRKETCQQLQTALDKIYKWSKDNKLALNIQKCSVITFVRRETFISYNYNIEEIPLRRTSEINDLGILFDSELTFSRHISKVTNDAFRMLGFVIRNSKHFKNEQTFKTLYFSFIRSKLEYCSVIWSPTYHKFVKEIERVQIKFIRFLHFKLTGNYPNFVSYGELANLYGLSTLESRRCAAAITMLSNIINNSVETSSVICNKVLLRVPIKSDSRSSQIMYTPQARTNLMLHSPFYRMCYFTNKLCHLKTLDIFYNKSYKINKHVLELLVSVPNLARDIGLIYDL